MHRLRIIFSTTIMLQCLLFVRVSSSRYTNARHVRNRLAPIAFHHPASAPRERQSSVRQLHSILSSHLSAFHTRPNPKWNFFSIRPISSSSLLSLSTTTHNSLSDFFALPSFDSIGIQSPILLDRIAALGLKQPTTVQASSWNAIRTGSGDVIVGAETGSGKTYAYLLPLIDDILQEKQSTEQGIVTSYDYARAVILVPNKELVNQVLRMAVPLCGGAQNSIVWAGGNNVAPWDKSSKEESDVDPKTVVRLAILPGGLMEPMDFKPFRDSIGLGGSDPPVDILFATPAALAPLALKPKHIDLFADIRTLVIDEADMLLDGGYIRPLENVLMGFRRADRLDTELAVSKTQHIFCAATLPDMGLRSVDAYLQRKFPNAQRIHMAGMHNARHFGLAEPTKWYQFETKKERMERLVDLFQTSPDNGGLQGEKVMVFLNSVEDVDGAHGALERAGIPSVPYHAKVPLDERSVHLDKFRRYSRDATEKERDTIPILVCTDLASRGLDVPGVNAVVQLQFAGNVVAHLHRMGRCGRAGQRTGRGIVFYSEKEHDLAQVVQEAEDQQERMLLKGDVMEDLLIGDELDSVGDEKPTVPGTVKKAFSRKRGFTKKRKKVVRNKQAESSGP